MLLPVPGLAVLLRRASGLRPTPGRRCGVPAAAAVGCMRALPVSLRALPIPLRVCGLARVPFARRRRAAGGTCPEHMLLSPRPKATQHSVSTLASSDVVKA